MPLLTVDEVASRLECSIQLVSQLIDSGQIQYINIGAGKQRRCIRISEESFAAFLRDRRIDMNENRSQTAIK